MGRGGEVSAICRYPKLALSAAMKTKGEEEAAISEAIVRFEIDYMGTIGVASLLLTFVG